MTRKRKPKFDHEHNDKPALLPKNKKQVEYMSALWRSSQVIVLGPAGTGKTFIAATTASDLYDQGKINKIVLTRPNVASGRSIGFFPGSLLDKMTPWVMPLTEVIKGRLGVPVYDTMLKNNNLEIVPFEVMRGRSFENAFVILDEGQNTTPEEMKMFLTRVGENTKVIINGDVSQSDLKETSGLSKVIGMVRRYGLPVPVIEFGTEDIVRSDMCKLWIEAWIADEK